ncbi:MAG TPA: phosphoribosylglycinamide formyltransferase [Anaerovoracaceae bacterium]|nr:phosphoribosylglycinamide formyltransferase [Anaerovoracaceae bacterium]
MVKKAKVAILISGGGTNLQAIIDKWELGELPHVDLDLVVSNRKDAKGIERAKAADIDSMIISEEDFEQELSRTLDYRGDEIIVLAGFLKILSEGFVKKYSRRIINVHPSLIPSFCGKGYYGLKVHEEVLKRGVQVSGATVHFVNEIPDGGEIIMQKTVDVLYSDTPKVLQKRIMEEAEWIILPKSLEKVAKKLVEDR